MSAVETYNRREQLLVEVNTERSPFHLTWDGVPVSIEGASLLSPKARLFEIGYPKPPESHNYGLPDSPLDRSMSYEEGYGKNRRLLVAWDFLDRIVTRRIYDYNFIGNQHEEVMFKDFAYSEQYREFRENTVSFRQELEQEREALKEAELTDDGNTQVLVQFKRDWADEFDVKGWCLYTKEGWATLLKAAKEYENWGQEQYFGTNEFISFNSYDDYTRSITVKAITEEEAAVIEKLLGREFGLYFEFARDEEDY